MTRFWLRFLTVLLLTLGSAAGFVNPFVAVDTVSTADLPKEAQATLRLIQTNGPFPYARDGITFGNYEKRLPQKPRGYYREYTVPTPGRRDRGPRRIVAGAGGEYYYTDDHYRTFSRIRE